MIYMKSENRKTSNAHRLSLTLIDKMDLQRGKKRVALLEFSIYYKWKNIKKFYKNNKFKISGATSGKRF